MSFNSARHHGHHHHHHNELPGRPLDLRDSSILAPMASSRRARAQQPAVSDVKMTPWGTDIGQDYDEAAEEQRRAAVQQFQEQQAKKQQLLNDPATACATVGAPATSPVAARLLNQQKGASHLDSPTAGAYGVPSESKTHNHYQNKETEQRLPKRQMATSKINASHLSGFTGVSDKVDRGLISTTMTTSAAQEEGEEKPAEGARAASPVAAGQPAHRGEKRRLLSSKVNESHGLWFQLLQQQQQNGQAAESTTTTTSTATKKEEPKIRPGTPKCLFPVSEEQAHAAKVKYGMEQFARAQEGGTSHCPNPQGNNGTARGAAVKNPWLGYTDSKEKFGGRVEKTGFW